ncbi:MAG: protein kinase [Lachnospiraceae bacterium]|nr:protein kinase [Lachnospiraceae bacterium]
MGYELVKELKQSEKSVVQLVRDEDSEKVFVRKILKGRHEVYKILENCRHPFLAEVYEVTVSDDETTVMEEYIEGTTPGSMELSGKQFRKIIKELCCVLEFIHKKGIIHRDIKPSNILLAGDGHIRLIDFDAARMYKEEQEQDTRLLGTKGYAPPEQYGFAQTDERTDIYSLGVTMEQFFFWGGAAVIPL